MYRGSLGVHDVGGVDSAETYAKSGARAPTETLRANSYAAWEKQVHGLRLALGKKGLITSDELRRVIEGMSKPDYETLPYYAKWLVAIVLVLHERGVLSLGELEACIQPTPPTSAESGSSPRFDVGATVRVKVESGLRWRKPHLRTPGYLHGCTGTVSGHCGWFVDPSYAAFREHILPRDKGQPRRQFLYSVMFRSVDVWGSVIKGEGDTIVADIFECWLEPCKELQPQQHHYYNAHGGCQESHGHTHDKNTGHEEHVHKSRAQIETDAASNEHEISPFESISNALLDLLEAKSIVKRTDVLHEVAALESIHSGRLGATLVVKAWTNHEFRRSLLRDAEAAARSIGIQTSNYNDAELSLSPSKKLTHAHGHTVLKVVENTDTTHNLVVCTLCSCYPVALLGFSPEWYKSSSYRARAVIAPRTLLRDDFGLVIPPTTQIRVWDSTAELRYLVLPQRPPWTAGWTDEQLLHIVTVDTMIGTALPTPLQSTLPHSHL